MSDTIRIGIAGLNYGLGHVSAFQKLDFVEITGLADSNEERQAAAKSIANNADLFPSAEELIEAGNIDAVVIATPSFLHERQIGIAFDKGLHVLCESPAGIRGSEVSHIVTTAGLVGKTFMCSNPLRFDPRIAKAKSLVSEGAIGEVFRLSSRALSNGWRENPDSWKLDRERGGGALLQNGLDLLDAVWFANGCIDPMEAMAGRFEAFSGSFCKELDTPAEDAIDGIVRFKDGSILHHSSQIHLGSNEKENEAEMRIWGSKGNIDLVSGLICTVEGTTVYAEPIKIEDQFLAQANVFIDAAAKASEPQFSGKQALACMKLLDALANSAKEKTAVSIRVERSLDDLFGSL